MVYYPSSSFRRHAIFERARGILAEKIFTGNDSKKHYCLFLNPVFTIMLCNVIFMTMYNELKKYSFN